MVGLSFFASPILRSAERNAIGHEHLAEGPYFESPQVDCGSMVVCPIGDVSGLSVWDDLHSDWILSGNQRRNYLSCRAFNEQNFLIDWAGRQDVLSIGGRSLMTGNPSIIL